MNKHADVATRYVRVKKSTHPDYVSFDFAIHQPDLSVELILPKAAFVEFCEMNRVVFMTPEQGASVDLERLKWRYGKEAPGQREDSNDTTGT